MKDTAPNGQDQASKTRGSDPAESAGRKPADLKSLDEALKVLDDAIASGHTGLKEMVTEEYRNLKEAISDIAPEFGSALGEMGQDAFGKVSEFTSELASKGQEYAQAGMEKGKAVARDIDEKVHENPWLMIGGVALGAFAIGFFLGGRDAATRPRFPEKSSGDRKPRGAARTQE